MSDQPEREIVYHKEVKNSMATAALVLGIIALVLSWIPIINNAGIICGILAVIFGFVGYRRAKRIDGIGKGAALAGIICGALGVVIAFAVIAAVTEELDKIIDELERDLEES